MIKQSVFTCMLIVLYCCCSLAVAKHSKLDQPTLVKTRKISADQQLADADSVAADLEALVAASDDSLNRINIDDPDERQDAEDYGAKKRLIADDLITYDKDDDDSEEFSGGASTSEKPTTMDESRPKQPSAEYGSSQAADADSDFVQGKFSAGVASGFVVWRRFAVFGMQIRLNGKKKRQTSEVEAAKLAHEPTSLACNNKLTNSSQSRELNSLFPRTFK